MDKEKVVQTLKEIFGLCGMEILKDRHKFEAYVEDLLSGPAYSAERLVLRHAMDSSALWPFIKARSITEEMARQAVEKLQQESRMTQEDARFVVQCVAEARGEALKDTAFRSSEQARTEGQKKTETGTARQEEKEQKSEEGKSQESEKTKPVNAVSISCKSRKSSQFLASRGELHLRPNMLEFITGNGKNWEFPFEEIKKISTGTFAKWFLIFEFIAVLVFLPLFLISSGEDLAVVIACSLFSDVFCFALSGLGVRSVNRRMTFTTDSLHGKAPQIYEISFYFPDDKKKAVSFIREHMPKKR